MEETLDVVQLWKDLEDYLIHFLHLSAYERAVYYHLLRHSRLVGRRNLRASTAVLCNQLGFCWTSMRYFLQNLVRKGCVRILTRGKFGYELEILLPEEIPGWSPPVRTCEPQELVSPRDSKNARLRRAIHRRDGGRCFYCLRALPASVAVLDHAVPMSAGGEDSVRNLVACCQHCNEEKKVQPAPDFLRSLYRTAVLTASELDERLAALAALQHSVADPQPA
jgi:5-methylcytosine-specific restriction endonuclease McrA